MPTNTTSNPCGGKVFTVEMHHKRVEGANPGDNVGMNVKGLDKLNMPRSGDVMGTRLTSLCRRARNSPRKSKLWTFRVN